MAKYKFAHEMNRIYLYIPSNNTQKNSLPFVGHGNAIYYSS